MFYIICSITYAPTKASFKAITSNILIIPAILLTDVKYLNTLLCKGKLTKY